MLPSVEWLEIPKDTMNQPNRPHRCKTYHGVVVPMVTPCTIRGELDEDAVRRVIDYLMAGGVHGVFVLGTTGEGDSVPLAIRKQLIAVTVDAVRGRAQVYAGISDNALGHSLDVAEVSAELGVDAVVAHLPSYFPLTASEQEAYFRELADRVALPLIIYNIPSTVHMSIPIEVVVALSEHPQIAAIKDSENNQTRLATLLGTLGAIDNFAILAGSAALSDWALALGADGIVPSSGNLVPGLCCDLYDKSLGGDVEAAKMRQQQIDTVAELYRGPVSLSQSLGRLKAVMGAHGLCEACVFPPLLPPTIDDQAALQWRYLEWRRSL